MAETSIDRPGDQDGRGGRDRPIIFSGPMIKALLAGRKTQTRRVLKPPLGVDPRHWMPDAPGTLGAGICGDRVRVLHWPNDGAEIAWGYLPCAVGDRLWIKEAARRSPDAWAYAADGTPIAWPGRGDLAGRKRDICNSLFLPRSCSRLTLIVEAVKVERLASISCADAIAEGIAPTANSLAIDCDTPDPRDDFRALWNSIHGPDAWAANPWVAAITFRAIPRNIDSLKPTPTGEDGAVPHLTTETTR